MDLQQLLNAGVLQAGTLTDFIINEVPRTPTRIGDMNLFESAGMMTDLLEVGINELTLTLVPAVPRGSPSQPKKLELGQLTHFKATHLPQRSTVMADELLYIRGRAGSNVEAFTGGVQSKINALQVVHKRDLDYTIEYHRLGAIKGLILNADGSTILDIYEKFGVTQQTQAMALGTAGTKVRQLILAVKRKVEDALGGIAYDRIHVFCSPEFMDKLISHPDVEKAYERFENGAALRDDSRKGFTFGSTGVTFEEVNGSIGGAVAIPANEAIAFPIGVPNMFITRYAPADTIDAIGAENPINGLPYYSDTFELDHKKGIELLSQSNPLNLNTRPRAVIRLTTN